MYTDKTIQKFGPRKKEPRSELQTYMDLVTPLNPLELEAPVFNHPAASKPKPNKAASHFRLKEKADIWDLGLTQRWPKD